MASSPAGVQPGLRQQHDVDVVVKNERGDVGSAPGRAADLALKRQTRRVFSVEKGRKGMRSSCLRVGRTGALNEEVVRSRSFGEKIGVVAEVSWSC